MVQSPWPSLAHRGRGRPLIRLCPWVQHGCVLHVPPGYRGRLWSPADVDLGVTAAWIRSKEPKPPSRRPGDSLCFLPFEAGLVSGTWRYTVSRELCGASAPARLRYTF
jgi:hypothetical protein